MTTSPKTELVVKSNALVNAMFDLGLQANRFLAFAISNLDRSLSPSPGQPVDLEIDVAAFAEAFDIAPNNAYGLVESLADQLQKKIIQFENTPGERIKVGLITRQKYLDGEGRVWLRFDEDLVPHLLGLKDRFTKYRIRDVYQFQRASTWRVYELLKQYKDVGKREIDIDEFKLKVGVSGLYPRITDLKRWVIDPAVSEINKTSDILIQFEQLKRGRKITGFKFFIADNQAAKNPIEKVRAIVEKIDDGRDSNPNLRKVLQEKTKMNRKQARQLSNLSKGRTFEDMVGLIDKLINRYQNLEKKTAPLAGYVFKALRSELTQGSLI